MSTQTQAIVFGVMAEKWKPNLRGPLQASFRGRSQSPEDCPTRYNRQWHLHLSVREQIQNRRNSTRCQL